MGITSIRENRLNDLKSADFMVNRFLFFGLYGKSFFVVVAYHRVLPFMYLVNEVIHICGQEITSFKTCGTATCIFINYEMIFDSRFYFVKKKFFYIKANA